MQRAATFYRCTSLNSLASITEALIDAILSDVHAAYKHLESEESSASKALPFLQPSSINAGTATDEAAIASAGST